MTTYIANICCMPVAVDDTLPLPRGSVGGLVMKRPGTTSLKLGGEAEMAAHSARSSNSQSFTHGKGRSLIS